ncbi:hypothetical protein ACIPY3_04490 [Paenarthrobacter sp. NPDC089714]|uniref:phage tail protein n=1 Tax=Paenarthrobacter sp. NPDC089714 TaxID=3364377 RepID=UPI003817AB88
MSNVGYATLTVIPSAKGFLPALNGEVTAPMAKVGKDGGEKSGNAFAGAFKGIIAPALALASAGAVTGFVGGAIAAAGELQQNIGAIETVFKGSSAQMLEWSDQAAMTVGLTSSEYDKLGTLIGSQLKNAGIPMEELAGKTNTLITQGADMASMFGGTTAEAVEALSSALKGESDPIERYGVTLNAAAVEAEAAAMGAKKVGGEYDDTAKKAAILSLITKQTADAQGNFAKEASTYSGQLERMKAGWGNITAAIGGAFLPVLTKTYGWINANAIPILQGWANWLGQGGIGTAWSALVGLMKTGDFSTAFREAFQVEEDSAVVGVLLGIRDQLLPLFGPLSQFKNLWTELQGGVRAFGAAWKENSGDVTSSGIPGFFEQVANALRPVFDAIMPLIPQVFGLVTAFSPLGILFRALEPVIPALLSAFTSLGTAVAGVLGTALTNAAPLVESLVSALSQLFVALIPVALAFQGVFLDAVTQLGGVFAAVQAAVIPLVTTLLSQLVPIITNLISTVLPPLVSIFGNIVSAIGPLVTLLLGLLIPAINALMPVVVTVFGIIANVITAAMTIIQGIIQVVTGIITGNWEQVWTGLGTILSGVWDLIVSVVTGAVALVGSLIGAALSFIGDLWNGAWTGISSFLGDTWNNITKGVESGIGAVVDFFGGLWDKITGAMGDLAGKMLDVGKDLMAGLAKGIGGAVEAVRKAISDAIGGAIDFAKDLLGIHSPSRVFMEIGDFTAQGMAVGLTKGAKHVQKAAAKSLVPPAPSFSSPDVTAGSVTPGTADGALPTGSPLIGSLTLQSSGNVSEDMDEVLFHTRRIARGGVYR